MPPLCISRGSVPRVTSWCTVRPQQSEYLIHNAKTDEMHLIPPVGYCVLQLCDGLNTVSDILERLGGAGVDRLEGERRLSTFVEELMARGILEVDDGG